MKMYEVQLILKNYQYHEKNNWEQTRTLAYISAQVNSSKKINPYDLMKFEWDEYNEIIKSENKKLTENDIELYRKKAKEIIKQNFKF